MANNVTNEWTAPAAVLATLRTGETAVDFNTVCPMPAVLTGEPSEQVKDLARLAMGFVTLEDLQRPTPDPHAAFLRGDYSEACQRLEQQIFQDLLRDGPRVKDLDDADFAAWLQCCRALKETGYPSWYEWNRAYWGTKWNAYAITVISPTVVVFQTAWNPPLMVLRALAVRHPGNAIHAAWADEDAGSNTGELIIAADGAITGGAYAANSPEALALATRLLSSEKEVLEC